MSEVYYKISRMGEWRHEYQSYWDNENTSQQNPDAREEGYGMPVERRRYIGMRKVYKIRIKSSAANVDMFGLWS